MNARARRVEGPGRAGSVVASAWARWGHPKVDSLRDSLDRRTPFGRLARVHVLTTAGDTLLTVSLAGSLFFSISPEAAKGKVILYLVLTMAPFAVVAPLLGPVIDRSRGARRATVALSCVGRAVMCGLMANSLKSLLLFPEAFTMLVLSKVYLVTKGALVPEYANASLSNAAPGESTADPVAGGARLAEANARLGLLASLSGFAAAIPAVAILKLVGGPWVLRLDVVVYAAATLSALRLSRPGPTTTTTTTTTAVAGAAAPAAHADDPDELQGHSGPLAALGVAGAHPEVTLALSAMSVLRGLVGFLTFLLAFSLRRAHAATWWFGLALAASVAGALIGVLLVPRLRRLLPEPQMLAVSIWTVAVFAVLAGTVHGLLMQVLLALVVGLAAAVGKPAFDAMVQRHIPPAAQGRAFARFETRLQLVWVLGALLPVSAAMPLQAGDVVIAAVAAVTVFSYLTGRRAVRQRMAHTR